LSEKNEKLRRRLSRRDSLGSDINLVAQNYTISDLPFIDKALEFSKKNKGKNPFDSNANFIFSPHSSREFTKSETNKKSPRSNS
jgi:hypothetical protein